MARRLAVLLVIVLAGCSDFLTPDDLVPKTAERDARLPSRVITVAGMRRAIHLRTFGADSNPPLLVLHGSLGDSRAFLPLASLADRYHVVLWDQRGNGLSERVPRAEYSFDLMVDEIEAVADAVAPGRPVTLVGHSFGAMYSALFMSRRPARVREAVLVEPGGLTGAIMQETFQVAINVNLFERNYTETLWQNLALTPADHERMDYKALLVLTNGRQTNYFCDRDRPPRLPVWRPGAYVEAIRGELLGNGVRAPDYDFSTGLDTLDRRVLFVTGSCSALNGAFQQRWHLPRFRRASLVELPNVGHRLMVENPAAFDAILRGFLAEYQR